MNTPEKLGGGSGSAKPQCLSGGDRCFGKIGRSLLADLERGDVSKWPEDLRRGSFVNTPPLSPAA
jgi:hypothetical protein